ncbi:uncharacterized protein LOC143179384 [Calliopsis andreniformis]|uniref:uncharacterized protein LOC143179384 n=1 Tax=Calliopsis andreniformis TaxID=337506 RepID=UPI003FCE2ABB
MTEHRGKSFCNSCVKVPVNPYSRQPTPSYERFGPIKGNKLDNADKRRKINFLTSDQFSNDSEISSPREITDNFLEFLESIPDYDQIHHLSNEQFKQEVEYLKRKQKLLLQNLQNSLVNHEDANISGISMSKYNQRSQNKNKSDMNDLKLNGKKCLLEESRIHSPTLFLSDKFAGLVKDQDLLMNSYKERDKEAEIEYNEDICSTNKNNNSGTDIDNIETRSLPTDTSKEWHPTVPKPFSFTLREEMEKYMTNIEVEEAKCKNLKINKKSPCRKRRIRPIPLTSKIPLYNRLLAEKEERSRMIREESALNLMSQVRPFKLECDRRAWRSLTRSSPEICTKGINVGKKFKAKPVPKNLFGTEIYDRMLEDEYYRQLQKRVRATELMKSSSLPPSMARRERVKSACTRLQDTAKNYNKNVENRSSLQLSSSTPVPFERCQSASLLSLQGNNLAAILRCQVSREKLEREIRDKMEEKRREQAIKLRESLIGRNPAWKALRCATRHEHKRDLNIRSSLRRDEAREQAERHRLQMEMMLNRVMQIPTLFERHSQIYQTIKTQQKNDSKTLQRKKTKKQYRPTSSSIDSFIAYENISRSDSGSLTSSSGTLLSVSQSSKSSGVCTSPASDKSIDKSRGLFSKKKDRSQLKVSIKETAELIEDQRENNKLANNEYFSRDRDDKNGSQKVEHDKER